MTLRVLLADDHPLFREGVAALLQSHGYEVAAMAGDGQSAIEQARLLKPDLILMDINMPHLDGLAATHVLMQEMPSTPVVMLTVSDDDARVFEAVKSGAKGYLLKNTSTAAFFAMLDAVASGDAPITRGLAGKILREFDTPAAEVPASPSASEHLSEREIGVLRLVSEGLTNREIGVRLGVSENTIKFHLKNILQKLHLRNRAQAVAYAIQKGLVGTTGSAR